MTVGNPQVSQDSVKKSHAFVGSKSHQKADMRHNMSASASYDGGRDGLAHISMW